MRLQVSKKDFDPVELAEKTQILRMIVGFLKIGQTEAPVRFIKLEALWILLNLSYGLTKTTSFASITAKFCNN